VALQQGCHRTILLVLQQGCHPAKFLPTVPDKKAGLCAKICAGPGNGFNKNFQPFFCEKLLPDPAQIFA